MCKTYLVVTDIACLFPPRAPVDGGCGGELAVVVPPPVGLVVEDLLVDVVLVVVRLLDGVSIGVHLGLHHHRGGNHLTEIIILEPSKSFKYCDCK